MTTSRRWATGRIVLVAAVIAGGSDDRLLCADGGVTLHDNGDTDGTNGYSNQTEGFVGFRRTLLDDFEVPAGTLWRIAALRHLHVTRGAPQLGMELTLWTDDDGVPGVSDRRLDVLSFTDTPTGRTWFDRPEYQAWTTFEPVTLCPGRYWFEGTVVPADSDFWMITGVDRVTGTECWVDYEDFGGVPMPGHEIFGVMSDLAWALLGKASAFATVRPEGLEVLGTIVRGALPALFESDDEHLVIANRPPPSALDPAVEVEITGTAPCGAVSAIRVRLEASCTALPPVVPQEIELYDAGAGAWASVDTRLASEADAVVEIVVTEEAGRFIEAETGRVRARVRWLDPGTIHVAGWSVRVDQAIWEVSP